jgi:phosphoribosyl 1,2-cyclic phosphodiesterase
MPAEPVFTITYWGAMGTLPTPLRPAEVTSKLVAAIEQLVAQGRLADLSPGADLASAIRQRVEQDLPFHLRSTYGGNTTCVEVQTPDALLILDCGTGLRELGIALAQRWDAPEYRGARVAHVLVTHPHLDHSCATPFVDPFYDPRNHFSVWASQRVLASFSAVLCAGAAMSEVYFPPTYDMLKGLQAFHEIKAGEDFAIGSTRIRTYALNHPGGCLAFRLENAGRVFVFATDHEHPAVPDADLAAFAHGADLLYTDGQYLAAEYDGACAVPSDQRRPRRGWGHSSVEACVATAVLAQVRALHVGHREPKRSDELTAAMERYLQQLLRAQLQGRGSAADACLGLIPFEGLTVRL